MNTNFRYVLFKKVLGRNTETYKELQAILYEIKLVLNNKPLMFTYKNSNDSVPTPYYLWHGRRLNLPVLK